VQELVSARRRNDPLAVLSTREGDVLALMAEGNGGEARSIVAKLRLPETDDDHRRVLAVVTVLHTR
jgi:hypothetical protein